MSRLSDWRESPELSWAERDEGWWITGAFYALFFGAPVILGLVVAAVTSNLWFLLVLVWPALWLIMGLAGG